MTENELIEAARLARRAAYAPYSRFQVGAALMTEDGRVFSGCNVENAAYPQGVCAEAGAISAMALGGGGRIRFVAISAGPDGEVRASLPCGGCRQKILEFAGDEAEVLVDGPEGLQRHRFADLMPFAFGPKDLDLPRAFSAEVGAGSA